MTVGKVLGIEETVAMLHKAPKLIVARGFFEALRDAGAVFNDELSRREPLGLGRITRGAISRDSLRRNRTVEINIDTQLRGGEVRVGYGAEGHKALWVEYGHRMVGHKPDKRFLGIVQPHPWMRPAFASAADRAIDAFVVAIKRVVTENLPQGATP